MDVVSLSSTNFIGLTANYSYDDTLSLNQSVYYTEQGLEIPLIDIFANLNDVSTNNYSNLYLSKYDDIQSSVTIDSLAQLSNESFSTYLAINAYSGITTNSRFLLVQEPDYNVNSASISMSGTYANIDNRYFFKITLLDGNYCRISHINAGVTRYLTVDVTGNLAFTPYTALNGIEQGKQSQVFTYIYDRQNDLLVLTKNISDVSQIVTYNSSLQTLLMTDPLSGSGAGYTTNSIFKLQPRNESSNTTKLFDPWVSYQKDFKTNSQNINSDRSFETVNSNILLNAEYTTISGSSLNVNLLSLKNNNTPENYQSRNNPFQTSKSAYFSGSEVSSRRYNKLFTGSNQTYGNDNITLGYDDYTTDIVLPADKITYFHVPQITYPFTQININDSGLIEAGAIAGDHPMKSDKVFKKLASAKYTTTFGNTNEETTSYFLCSWLSGGNNPSVKPVWVDRFYNPSKLAFIAALTGTSYSLDFDNLNNSVKNVYGDLGIYDKLSDLIFEPGTYYAYHHIGNNDVLKYISSLQPYLVDNTFSKFVYTNNSDVNAPGIMADEYSFDGNTYAITQSLSSIEDSNQFTLSFFAHNYDWTMPFGNQIVGNYVNDGFGVFNTNNITPTIFVNSTSGINILNTDFTSLKSITYNAQPIGYMRRDGMRHYYGIFNDGTFTRFNAADTIIKQTNNSYLSSTIDFDYTDSTGYILCSTGNTTKVLQADLTAATLTDITTLSSSNLFYSPNCSISAARTIDYYNNNLYFTPGILSKRVNDTIFYLSSDNSAIVRWDNINTSTSVTSAFESSVGIIDFNIDNSNNIWILNKQNKFSKYSLTRDLILSGSILPNNQITVTTSITGNGSTVSFQISGVISQNPNDYIININNVTQRPSFDYSLSGNNVVFVNPPPLSSTGTVYVINPVDTYNNLKVNFISEFVSGSYNQYALITRSGYSVYQNALSSTHIPGYQFNVLSLNGVPVLSSTFTTATASNVNIINNDFLRNYIFTKYGSANLNIKASLINVFNSDDVLPIEIISNLSAVDPGYHHFAIRFDSYNGFMMLFIDGQQAGSVQFAPRKYKFSNFITRPFLFGSSAYKNAVPLFSYLKKNAYLVEGVKIKNYYLYNTALNDCDIAYHAREGMTIHDIHLDLPCGHRNYLEEIERYFKATVPGSKSTQYNIIIKNTGITDATLKEELEKRILTELKNTAPVYSKLNTIKWSN
jgi:hypothetical protein